METSSDAVERVLENASTAALEWARVPPRRRAEVLRDLADGLDRCAGELVAAASDETHLPDGRLRGELARTTFQLRLFAEVLDEGAFLDARIDHANADWPMGARPDIRRVRAPLGPVLNFAASNFPFAFSVAGGDTASALAAGCPVVVKASPGHERLSALTAEVADTALRAAAAPEAVLQVLYGQDAGVQALRDERVRAATFTGSLSAGRMLFDIATGRPTPIPFYAEMGSVNPVFVTEAAAGARGDEVAAAYLESVALGAGQFCTKPGVIFVPSGTGMVEALRRAVPSQGTAMLNEHIHSGYVARLRELADLPGVAPLVLDPGAFDQAPSDPAASDPAASDRAASGGAPPVSLLRADLADVLEDPRLLEECFGPAALVVEYPATGDLLEVARRLEGQLTATIIAEQDDEQTVGPLVDELATRVGRLLWNQYPTGVSVTYAQHHGGPYPATTSPLHTSVGTAAIERFLRPVAYQGFPQSLLPGALRDTNPLDIPRRVT